MPEQLSLNYLLVTLPVLLLSLMLHEISHGFAAYMLGDLTAKQDGRLSLNPLRHIDPIGFILMVLYKFGWAKPVRINPNNLKNPKRDMAIVSLAGPLSNFILSIVFFIPIIVLNAMRSPPELPDYLISVIYDGLSMNISLAVFNMLPVPPLDGSKVFGCFLPDKVYYRVVHAGSRIGMGVLLLLSFTGVLSKIISPVNIAVINFYFFAGSMIAGLFRLL